MWRSALAVGAVSSSLACGASPAGPSTSVAGIWGGDHIALTVTRTGSRAEFDCAHGDLPGPFTVDGRHAFNVSGTFVREHGGPIVIGELPDSRPARYFGSVTANTMALAVALADTGEMIGMFTLVRDTPGRVVKCLSPSSN